MQINEITPILKETLQFFKSRTFVYSEMNRGNIEMQDKYIMFSNVFISILNDKKLYLTVTTDTKGNELLNSIEHEFRVFNMLLNYKENIN